MLTTFLVPIWVDARGTRYRIWIKVKNRTHLLWHVLCCCRKARHLPRSLDDDDETVHFPLATDPDVTQRILASSPSAQPPSASLPATAVVEAETMPREIAEYLSRALVWNYSMQAAPVPATDIRASDVTHAIFVLVQAEKIVAATGARRYYTLLQHTLRMLTYVRQEHHLFAQGLREIAEYVQENHIALPQNVLAALRLDDQQEERLDLNPQASTPVLTSAPPTPETLLEMQRPVLPLVKFLMLVLQRCIRYVDLALADIRIEERDSVNWYKIVVRGEDVELTPLERLTGEEEADAL